MCTGFSTSCWSKILHFVKKSINNHFKQPSKHQIQYTLCTFRSENLNVFIAQLVILKCSVSLFMQHCGSEKLVHPVMYMGSFLKPGRAEETTLLQVCSGKLEHINLKQVVSSCQARIWLQPQGLSQIAKYHRFDALQDFKEEKIISYNASDLRYFAVCDKSLCHTM